MIRRPAQLRALASPARQEVIDALVAAGPLSVAEIAAHLGRAADSLYFHLRQLEKVGLIREIERRQSGRHVAVVYDVPGRPMRIDPNLAAPKPLGAVISGVLRLAQRDYRRSLSDPRTVIDGPCRELWGGRVKGWVAPEDLTRVNALLEELQRVVRDGRPGEGRRGVSFTFVLAPVRKKSVKSSTSARSGRKGKS